MEASGAISQISLEAFSTSLLEISSNIAVSNSNGNYEFYLLYQV